MSSLTWLALLLFAAAALLQVLGWRQLVSGAQAAGAPDQTRRVIGGFRRLMLSCGLLCFGVALWTESANWAWFGAAFLLEELIETTVMLWALRRRS